MRLKVKILDSHGAEKRELVVDVPNDITVDGLVNTLRTKRPELFDSKEYVGRVEVPGNKALGGKLLEDDSLIIIKPKGWDWDVRILGEG